ncbi:MAG: DUF2934 domain-containing protein [Opitutus sp.]
MKAKVKTPLGAPLTPTVQPTDDEVRDYAYHLYVQSGCVPGRDLENWLDAQSCLEANIPQEQSHKRSARHRHRPATASAETVQLVGVAGSDLGNGVVVDEFILVQPLMTPRP